MIVEWLTFAALVTLVVIGLGVIPFLRDIRDDLRVAGPWIRQISGQIGSLPHAFEVGYDPDADGQSADDLASLLATEDGRKAGRDWAMQSAEHDALKRVCKLDADMLFEPDIVSGDCMADTLIEAMVGDREKMRDIVREPHGDAEFFGIDEENYAAPGEEWCAGFVEGAKAVWEETADKI